MICQPGTVVDFLFIVQIKIFLEKNSLSPCNCSTIAKQKVDVA